MAFAYTPYDGSQKPFSIAMKTLDPRGWIEPDSFLSRHLAEKDDLIATERDVVFREEAETRQSQAEILRMLADFLPARFPDIYRRVGDRIDVLPAGRSVGLSSDEPPLLTASRLVQEDLVLMRDGPGGYRLAAASLCFPSSWSLAEKFGQTLDGLHTRVPGYPDGLATRMNRIFANLKTEMPVTRTNWGISPDAELHHPESKERPRNWFGNASDFAAAFIRCERQTLRRMPVSGDILFTIKIYVDPLATLRAHPDRARLAHGMRENLLAMNEGQLAYKALLDSRDRLADALAEIAGEPSLA